MVPFVLAKVIKKILFAWHSYKNYEKLESVSRKWGYHGTGV